ncbi:MAG TPA: hypothetical protein VMV31_07055, partial [Terriglobales bacterium]|nr:hypothetical protein [Terriglobales bacterium]
VSAWELLLLVEKGRIALDRSRGSRRFACGQNRRERLRTGAPRARRGLWGGRNSAGAAAQVPAPTQVLPA